MSHKFAAEWHCYLAGDDGLDYKGMMDLSTMNANGDLDRGRYHSDEGEFRIRGRVRGAGAFYVVSLEVYREEDDDEYFDSYQGVLAYESPTAKYTVVAGSLHYGDAEKRLDDQNDPPWVITKP